MRKHCIYCYSESILSPPARLINDLSSVFSITLLFLGSLSLSDLFSQSIYELENYEITRFGQEDGLTHTICNSLLYDRNGFLWIGTQDGLNRYDGEQFRAFRNSKYEGIPGNFINDLFEDSRGFIWFSTVDHGIAYYDTKLEEFHKIEELGDFTGLSFGRIIEDAKNRMWIATVESLFELTLQSDSFHVQRQENPIFDSLRIQSLTPTIGEGILIASKKGQVYRLENNILDEIFSAVPLPIVSIRWIRDHLIVATSQGCSIVNLQTGKTDQIEVNGETGFIYGAIEDKGNLWLHTDQGIFFLTEVDGNWVSRRYFSNLSVYDICLSNDFIWLATNEGLLQIRRSESVFKDPLKDVFNSNTEHYGTVSAILKTEDGLWIGMRGEGLYYLTEDHVYHYDQETDNNNLKSWNIRTMELSQNNHLWVGTVYGISTLDLETMQPEQLVFQNFDLKSSSKTISNDLCNNTRQVYSDHDGLVWVTTFGGGLFRFTGDLYGQDFAFDHYSHTDGCKNCLSSNQLHCIQQDKNSTYWIGTRNGLVRMESLSGENNEPDYTTYYHDPNDPTSIASNAIYDIFVDEDNSLWLGTQDGLSHFYPDLDSSRSYDYDSGLPNLVINSILKDEQDNIWVSTNSGICRLDRAKELFTCYTSKDGLSTETFEIFCKSKDVEGILYFGGVNGLCSFHPDSIINLDVEGDLAFTGLKIENRELTANNSEILSQAIQYTDNIRIKYDQFPLSVRFSDRDFRTYKNYEYFYMLSPQDEKWNSIDDKTSIDLIYLKPGTHNLSIRGSGHGKVWNTEPLHLKIQVVPPWWKSNLAWISYFLFIVVISFFILRIFFQRTQARRDLERLKNLEEFKSRLYTNITHEFRTPLTVIQGMADVVKEKIAKNQLSNIDHSLTAITSNSKKLLTMVNQMLDLAKAEKGKLELSPAQSDIVSFLRYAMEGFHSVAENKSISLVFYAGCDEFIMDFDPDKLMVIVSNLISNAIKYTPQRGQIILHVDKVDSKPKPHFMIKVKDSGFGIHPKDQAHIFDRFYQTDHHSNKTEEGTGIGLALTKELTELMSGSIEVKSKLNKGAEFTVVLPVTNNAKLKASDLQSKIERPTSFDELKLPDPKTFARDSQSLILIVEDNLDVASYLRSCLEDQYYVIHAINGELGVELAIQYLPNLIISDVMMPVKDGYALCRELKSDVRTDHIPIIILTAKATDDSKIVGLESGADAYLTKPFSKRELFARIDQMITLRKRIIEKFGKTPFTQWLHQPANDTQSKFIQKATQVVLDNLDVENFNAEILARELHFSQSQTYRKIKAITDKSTAIFIRSVRLGKAHEKLQNEDLSISEIAYACGFNDIAYFNRSFKKEFGVSPGQVR